MLITHASKKWTYILKCFVSLPVLHITCLRWGNNLSSINAGLSMGKFCAPIVKQISSDSNFKMLRYDSQKCGLESYICPHFRSLSNFALCVLCVAVWLLGDWSMLMFLRSWGKLNFLHLCTQLLFIWLPVETCTPSFSREWICLFSNIVKYDIVTTSIPNG